MRLTLGLILAVAVLAIAIILLLRWHAAESVAVGIERQNNAAGNQSDDARGGYSRCIDRGGVWDFGTGKCGGPAKGGRY